jgi:hypothetical protein
MKFLALVFVALGVGSLAERAQAQGGGCMRGGGGTGSMMSPMSGSMGAGNYQSAYLQQQLAYQNQYQYQLQLAMLQQQTQLQQAYLKEQSQLAAEKREQRERKAAERRERKESGKERRLAAAKTRQASLTSAGGDLTQHK